MFFYTQCIFVYIFIIYNLKHFAVRQETASRELNEKDTDDEGSLGDVGNFGEHILVRAQGRDRTAVKPNTGRRKWCDHRIATRAAQPGWTTGIIRDLRGGPYGRRARLIQQQLG